MTSAIAIGAPVTAVAGAQMRDRVLARGRRTTASTTATNTPVVPVLRLDDIPVDGGVLYGIRASYTPFSTVLTDILRVEVRYTTNGATPVVSSPVLPGAQAYPKPDDQPQYIDTTYTPAAAETLSLLLTVVRNNGSGNVSLFADANRLIELYLFSWGVDPTDTGVDL